MKQWHPVFAQLLRPAVEGYYEVQTTVPVGDAPREADIVLLRRTSQATPPFRGQWRHLASWNILEFKGPTVSPRRGDIELLVELGLGIDRRLRVACRYERRHAPLPEDVSFWYLANQLGSRFLREAERSLGTLEMLDSGLWRCRLLRRLVFLVSSIELPVEEDSLPLHVVGREPLATERQVARLVVENSVLRQHYGAWVATLHDIAWKEVEQMARRELFIDFRPVVKSLGLARVLESIGVERVIEQVGIDRVIETLGEREVVRRIGLERILANLSAAERRELKRRL